MISLRKRILIFIALLFPLALQSKEVKEISSLPSPEANFFLHSALDKQFSGPLAVAPELVLVEDPGNPIDSSTGLGSVSEPFQIGKYEITVLQWATFLNAVHVVEGNTRDPRGLYHPEIFFENNPNALLCSLSGVIKKTTVKKYELAIKEKKVTLFYPREWGTPLGHYYGSLPMTGLSIEDCKRYANWLHHGLPFIDPLKGNVQLTKETLAYTETGAYDFTKGKKGELLPGAKFFIPSLNQWYKAAYYKPGSNGHYWSYPTNSDQLPYQFPSYLLFQKGTKITGANYAHIAPNWPHLKFYYQQEIHGQPLTTPVGTFKESPGPYGTYDMGGNVREWTVDCREEQPSQFAAPGGSYEETSEELLSTHASTFFEASIRKPTIGFRIAATADVSIPTYMDTFKEAEKDPSKQTLPRILPLEHFLTSLGNITIAQVSAYGLESFLYGVRYKSCSPDVLCGAFTYQRNITNTLIAVFLAGFTTGEATYLPITKDDLWNVGWIVGVTVLTMFATESAAFVVEGAVGECIKALEGAGFGIKAQNTLEGATWQRLLTNFLYIGMNTYSTTSADLKYFNEQQKLATPKSQ